MDTDVRASTPLDRREVNLGPELAAVSDRGLIHGQNEDAVALLSAPPFAILVVCDGVSTSQDPALIERRYRQPDCLFFFRSEQSGQKNQQTEHAHVSHSRYRQKHQRRNIQLRVQNDRGYGANHRHHNDAAQASPR